MGKDENDTKEELLKKGKRYPVLVFLVFGFWFLILLLLYGVVLSSGFGERLWWCSRLMGVRTGWVMYEPVGACRVGWAFYT